MAEPGPVEVRRLADGSVLVGTTQALVIDVAWARTPLDQVRVLEAAGWADAGSLSTPLVVDAALIERLQARTGHAFVWLHLTGAS